MSEILIKGLKIKDYPQTITINPDGSVIKDTFGLHRLVEEWKAIEVPTHGRLGNLDALAENIKDVYCKNCKRSKVMCKACEYGDMIDEIENAPTIIEAST